MNAVYPQRLDALNHLSDAYGGHPKTGTLRDIAQAEVFGALHSEALEHMTRGEQFIMVHVGSKFMKAQTLWENTLRAFYEYLAAKLNCV